MEGHRFLDSDHRDPEPLQFEALGHAGSEHYAGLETFDNPGCTSIVFNCDELIAHCPVTGQPDFYDLQIVLLNTEKSIESKSLKLWLRQFADAGNGTFCESLAVYIRDKVGESLEYDAEDTDHHIQVTLRQKSRGGISIRVVA